MNGDDPQGPFVFDTSAESWLARATAPGVVEWLQSYMELHPVYVSAATVIERLNGYNLLLLHGPASERDRVLRRRNEYVGDPDRVLPIDVAVAATSAEVLALLPDPPSPPKRSHKAAESRSDRLVRWRFDTLVAATALVNRMPVLHNNPEDFEAIRMVIEIHPERLGGLGPLELYRCTRLGASVRTATGR